MILRLPFSLPLAAAVTVWPVIIISRSVRGWTGEDQARLLVHERVHLAQQRRWLVRGLGVGLLAWWLLYLLALPAWRNPWRRRWETEAYRAQGMDDDLITRILSRAPYWLHP